MGRREHELEGIKYRVEKAIDLYGSYQTHDIEEKILECLEIVDREVAEGRRSSEKYHEAMEEFSLLCFARRYKKEEGSRGETSILYTSKFNSKGLLQDCVVARCRETGYEVPSWGHGEKSVKRSLALLGQECACGRYHIAVRGVRNE